MPGGDDPDNRRDFPSEKFAAPGELYTHIAKLARLRQEKECLRRGELINLVATDTTYSYMRKSKGCEVTVTFANGTVEIR